MKKVRIADATLKEAAGRRDVTLTFREKTEIAKLLETTGVDTIELPAIYDTKPDTLLVKTLAAVLRRATVSLCAGATEASCEEAWNALKNAAKPRLRVCVPVSPVQMEYFCHKKAPEVLEMIGALVAKCVSLCPDVEFCAEDATRSEKDFLYAAINTAVDAGAKTVTLCDTAGTMLPDEFSAFIKEVGAAVPALAEVTLGVRCSDAMQMATACAAASILAGAAEIKTAVSGFDCPYLSAVSQLFRLRGESRGFTSSLDATGLHRAESKVLDLIRHRQEILRSDASEAIADGMLLTRSDDLTTVAKAVKQLGYELSEDDNAKVYEAFQLVAAKKNVSLKELDAVVATAAMQVPSTYRLKSYVINSGNVISATANLEIEKNGSLLRGISLGDGPIDAAFMAIEQIVGVHYELDDFRIQSITEGREAIGNAVIRLRANGRLYAGNGISTDIVGASIRAYLNALNKIVYEEKI